MRISDWSSDVCSSDLLFGTKVQCLTKSNGPCNLVGRDLLFDVTQHEVDDCALGEFEQVADGGDQHSLDTGPGPDFGHGVSEVFQYQDGRSPRIDQLLLELARGVHRVGIDHRHADATHAADERKSTRLKPR